MIRHPAVRMTINGHVPDCDPIAHVKAASDQISRIIQRGMSRSLAIRPVLLYVGWYAEQPKRSDIASTGTAGRR